MKPSVNLVSSSTLSNETLSRIASQLGMICDSPIWTVSTYHGHSMPVYTFTSTRKSVPMNRYGKCQSYVEGIQFGINHA